MGELDQKPFHVAAKKMYNSGEAAVKAVELCSLWEDHLRDPNWHPYKVIQKGQTAVVCSLLTIITCVRFWFLLYLYSSDFYLLLLSQEIIDEDDEKLKGLKAEYGDQVYEAVVTALNELNEHNPSGRYPVPQLWNNKEKRTARVNEGAEFIVKQWKQHKKKTR